MNEGGIGEMILIEKKWSTQITACLSATLSGL